MQEFGKDRLKEYGEKSVRYIKSILENISKSEEDVAHYNKQILQINEKISSLTNARNIVGDEYAKEVLHVSIVKEKDNLKSTKLTLDVANTLLKKDKDSLISIRNHLCIHEKTEVIDYDKYDEKTTRECLICGHVF